MSLMQDKTVLVTGVGVGLGREVAASLLEAGSNVVIAARTESKLDEAANALEPPDGHLLAHPVDINDGPSCEALVQATQQRFGRLDAVVQVAAYEGAFGGVLDADLERWQQSFDTNVIGAMKLLRAAVPVMTNTGGGAVVLIGSQSMFKPALPQAGYAASKGALLSTMYYLADELGPDNIRVNMVVPSWMWGPNVEMFVDYRATSEGKSKEDVLAEITGTFPMRRMTEDREVADAALFFCSDLSRGITGQHLMVNCGEIMR
jgi:NAD(P)-dependent dehydrogenase (short-subunit alcohol dehydrogenase family)